LSVKPMAKKEREVATKPAVKSFLLLKYRDRYPETAGNSEYDSTKLQRSSSALKKPNSRVISGIITGGSSW
jgi:hypothetical protein